MSTPSWQRSGNTYCKYCQQWISDRQKRIHDTSKHHIANVQKHINNQQILERNKQKEEQRNRKILDNIERKVKNSSNDDGENPYYQAFLKHQQEMEKLPSSVMENVFNEFTNQQQSEDIPYTEEPHQQVDVIQESEPSDSFECNDLPLGEIAKSKPIEAPVTAPHSNNQSKKKKYEEPTEIGSYYDDPNFFYYEQEEEEKNEKDQEQVEHEEVVQKKEKPPSDWKNQFSNLASSANTFGQWEIVKVSKIETESVAENVQTKQSLDGIKPEHEEDQFGGSYSLPESKKRKNESEELNSKKVKTEEAPRKPLSFSLSKKK